MRVTVVIRKGLLAKRRKVVEVFITIRSNFLDVA